MNLIQVALAKMSGAEKHGKVGIFYPAAAINDLQR
jgi:hypothetical protein